MFCGAIGGCYGGLTLYQQGRCTLKYQDAVTNGIEPEAYNRGVWVSWTSGTVIASDVSASG